MNVYKLTTAAWETRVIDKATFENDTAKCSPYYQRNATGDESQFAVCPACNNPIQLIGLYPKRADANKPFGRHVPHGIAGLAEYNQDAYNFCPYANPGKYNPSAQKISPTGLSSSILQVLREQYDRVIYLLGKETGIVISDKLAESMLRNYMGVQGYLYAYSTLMNIPWMLAYRAGSFPLFGRVIREGSELKQRILSIGENVAFNDRGQLTPNEGRFLDMSFCFVGHQSRVVDLKLDEFMDFLVIQVVGKKKKEIYRRTITFDWDYFQTLTHMPEDHPNRRMALVEMARTCIHV